MTVRENLFARICLCIFLCLLTICCGWEYLKCRWSDLFLPAHFVKPYDVRVERSDTLRIIIIGDSWAGMHPDIKDESYLYSVLSCNVSVPLKIEKSGKGGAKSKDVYYLMFEKYSSETDIEKGYCTEALIKQSPNYCVVLVGINDAAANLGVDYYCHNYKLIIQTLLTSGIIPVIVEMPPVNIRGLYADKPLKDKISDWLKSKMAHSDLYDVCRYSSTLLDWLDNSIWKDSVIIVKSEQWNQGGFRDPRRLYMADEIHLNETGYHLLDSCVAVSILCDIQKHKHD